MTWCKTTVTPLLTHWGTAVLHEAVDMKLHIHAQSQKKSLIETGPRDWINPQDLMTGFWNANESPEKADLSELICSSGIFRIYVVLCGVDRDSAWWLRRNSSKTGRKSIICIYFAVRNFCLGPRWVPLRIGHKCVFIVWRHHKTHHLSSVALYWHLQKTVPIPMEKQKQR